LADEPYSFSAPIPKNFYLHARWVDGNGGNDPGETVGVPGSGGLDGDGFVTIGEALIAAQALITGTGDLTPAQIDALDVDRDGLLTMADIVLLMRLAAGL